MRKTSIAVDLLTRSQLIEAGFAVMRKAVRQTPIDLGNLRASSYVWWPSSNAIDRQPKIDAMFRAGKEGDDTGQLRVDRQLVIGQLSARFQQLPVFVVVVGFTAYYSIYVHENETAHHNVGNAKFLERALEEALPEVVANFRRIRL